VVNKSTGNGAVLGGSPRESDSRDAWRCQPYKPKTKKSLSTNLQARYEVIFGPCGPIRIAQTDGKHRRWAVNRRRATAG